jgi:3-deoxy-7-phosphoheptulonate synthase
LAVNHPSTRHGWSGVTPPPESDPSGWGTIQPTENLHVESAVSLISPVDLDAELPATPRQNRTVVEGRATIQQILSRTDRRMMVIVGPCSIHDDKAAIEYAQRLADLRRRVIDRLFLVMRVYFEKPRTTTGWKGLINDPYLNGSFDIARGLRIARGLLLEITGLGVPTATEMLDPITPQYIDDLVCWAAIGARTTESQTHRQMASGLSMPVGFKNSTEGNLQVAVDAMNAARSSHAFLGMDEQGRTAVIKTRGNPWGHPILRGGRQTSNFNPEAVADASALLAKANLPANLMVDCSHANSGKQPENQHVAWQSVIEQRVAGNDDLIGLMLESNLFEGSQPMTEDISQLRYGVSITDSCIDWEQTEKLVMWAYDHLPG